MSSTRTLTTIFLSVIVLSCAPARYSNHHEYELLHGPVESIVLFTDRSGYNYFYSGSKPYEDKREYKKEADKEKSEITIFFYDEEGSLKLKVEPKRGKKGNHMCWLSYFTYEQNGVLRRTVKYGLFSEFALDINYILARNYKEKKLSFHSRIETDESFKNKINYHHFTWGDYSRKPSQIDTVTLDNLQRVISKETINSSSQITSRSRFSYQKNKIEEQRTHFKNGETIGSSTKIINYSNGIKKSERLFRKSEVQVIEYDYLTFDHHGNWLTRIQKHTLMSQTMDIDIEPTTETRIIEYR